MRLVCGLGLGGAWARRFPCRVMSSGNGRAYSAALVHIPYDEFHVSVHFPCISGSGEEREGSGWRPEFISAWSL